MDDYEPRPRFSMTLPAAFAALAIGTVVGAVVGYIAHAIVAEPALVIPPPAVIKEEISEEDLLALCAELTDDEKTKVLQAHERVKTLQAELDAREAELTDLKKAAAGDEKRRKAAAKKWRQMEDEIASLRVQLASAEQERDELRVELKATLKDLDKQIKETQKFKKKAKMYQEKSTANLWSAFLNDGKVQICDRGTRKRHAKCHDSVESAFDSRLKAKFTTCVDTYQAVPVLKQAEKGAGLPRFAEALPDDNKFTKKGWYIIFCDPTLPERRDEDLDGVQSPGRSGVDDAGYDDVLDDALDDLPDGDLDLDDIDLD